MEKNVLNKVVVEVTIPKFIKRFYNEDNPFRLTIWRSASVEEPQKFITVYEDPWDMSVEELTEGDLIKKYNVSLEL